VVGAGILSVDGYHARLQNCVFHIPTCELAMAQKPVFIVHISDEVQSALEARVLLARATEERCFHTMNGLRLPLGIYNVSVARVSDKISRLSHRIEDYFRKVRTVNSEQGDVGDDLMQEVIDYIELSLYAAAEHVDDIDLIASGFFKNRALRDRDSAYRELQKAVKQHKRFVSAAANAIKHQQSRIRIFSMQCEQKPSFIGCLHGYFIEGVEKGVVCPSTTFHRGQEVFSITALVWEIIVFLLNCSRDLAVFLKHAASKLVGPIRALDTDFSKALAAAIRLPAYTFGEEHPLSRVTLHIGVPRKSISPPADSDLYGSFINPWSRGAPAIIGPSVSRYASDGISRSFRLADPRSVVLHHWD